MRFLLLIRHGSDFTPPDNLDSATSAWVAEREERSERVVGDRLTAPGEGVIVKHRDGGLVEEAGPPTSDDVQIAGFDVIECADLDQAVEIVSRHPMTARGSVEIRPVWAEVDDA